LAKKNEAFEAIARHVLENLPQYMPYIKYAGVFLVGFVSGMLWSQAIQEEPPPAKPATRQTKKSTSNASKVTNDDSKPTKTTKRAKDAPDEKKPAKSATKKSVGKFLDVPETENAPNDPDVAPDPEGSGCSERNDLAETSGRWQVRSLRLRFR
jgi:hypothetical protein